MRTTMRNYRTTTSFLVLTLLLTGGLAALPLGLASNEGTGATSRAIEGFAELDTGNTDLGQFQPGDGDSFQLYVRNIREEFANSSDALYNLTLTIDPTPRDIDGNPLSGDSPLEWEVTEADGDTGFGYFIDYDSGLWIPDGWTDDEDFEFQVNDNVTVGIYRFDVTINYMFDEDGLGIFDQDGSDKGFVWIEIVAGVGPYPGCCPDTGVFSPSSGGTFHSGMQFVESRVYVYNQIGTQAGAVTIAFEEGGVVAEDGGVIAPFGDPGITLSENQPNIMFREHLNNWGSDWFYTRLDIERTVAPGRYSGLVTFSWIANFDDGDETNDVFRSAAGVEVIIDIDWTPLLEVETNSSTTSFNSGDTVVDLQVTLRNTGNVDLQNVEVEIDLSGWFKSEEVHYQGYSVVRNSISNEFPLVAQDEAITAEFTLTVDGRIPPGTHRLPVLYDALYFDDGTLPAAVSSFRTASQTMVTTVTGLAPFLDIAVVDTTPGSSIDLFSTQQFVYDYGATLVNQNLYVNVINPGEVTLINSIATLDTTLAGESRPLFTDTLNPESTAPTVMTNTVQGWLYGDGNSRNFYFRVDIHPNFPAGLYDLTIHVSGLNQDNNEPVSVDVPISVLFRPDPVDMDILGKPTVTNNVPGAVMNISFTLINHGGDTVQEVQVTYGQYTNIGTFQKIRTTIAPGQTINVTFLVQLEDTDTPGKYEHYIRVYTIDSNGRGVNENIYYWFELLGPFWTTPNLRLSGVELSTVPAPGKSTVVTLTIVNDGTQKAKGLLLTHYNAVSGGSASTGADIAGEIGKVQGAFQPFWADVPTLATSLSIGPGESVSVNLTLHLAKDATGGTAYRQYVNIEYEYGTGSRTSDNLYFFVETKGSAPEPVSTVEVNSATALNSVIPSLILVFVIFVLAIIGFILVRKMDKKSGSQPPSGGGSLGYNEPRPRADVAPGPAPPTGPSGGGNTPPPQRPF